MYTLIECPFLEASRKLRKTYALSELPILLTLRLADTNLGVYSIGYQNMILFNREYLNGGCHGVWNDQGTGFFVGK